MDEAEQYDETEEIPISDSQIENAVYHVTMDVDKPVRADFVQTRS